VRLLRQLECGLPAQQDAVVDQVQVRVARRGQCFVRRDGVHEAPEQVRDLPLPVPRVVRLEQSGEALEQQRRRPGALHLGVDCVAVGRVEGIGEPLELPVHDQARPHLEDVGALPDQARVLHHLRPPASGLDHDLHPRAVTGLERAGGQQGEGALAVTEQRGSAPQQGPVEIGVDRPDRHAG
jgi:hypothetical protein